MAVVLKIVTKCITSWYLIKLSDKSILSQSDCVSRLADRSEMAVVADAPSLSLEDAVKQKYCAELEEEGEALPGGHAMFKYSAVGFRPGSSNYAVDELSSQ